MEYRGELKRMRESHRLMLDLLNQQLQAARDEIDRLNAELIKERNRRQTYK